MSENTNSTYSCLELRIYGTFYGIVSVLGFVGNSYIIFLHYFLNKLQTSKNLFVLGLTIMNLMACIVDLPPIAISCLSCK